VNAPTPAHSTADTIGAPYSSAPISAGRVSCTFPAHDAASAVFGVNTNGTSVRSLVIRYWYNPAAVRSFSNSKVSPSLRFFDAGRVVPQSMVRASPTSSYSWVTFPPSTSHEKSIGVVPRVIVPSPNVVNAAMVLLLSAGRAKGRRGAGGQGPGVGIGAWLFGV